jgi:hypothetical protein
MRKPDLFAWGQINENDPPWQGTDDRVRVIVLEKMSSNLFKESKLMYLIKLKHCFQIVCNKNL